MKFVKFLLLVVFTLSVMAVSTPAIAGVEKANDDKVTIEIQEKLKELEDFIAGIQTELDKQREVLEPSAEDIKDDNEAS